MASDEPVSLQQRVRMRDEGFGRRGNIADVMKCREIGLAMLRQAVDDMRAQVVRRFEEVDDILFLHTLLECLELDCAFALFHIVNRDRMRFIHHENQARDLRVRLRGYIPSR